MPDDVSQHDQRVRRCPMLGHDVPFAYCRAPGSELPCRRIFDCWWESFDVEGFIRSHCPQEVVEEILAPRGGKMTTILDLIRKAKRRAEGNSNE